MRTCSNQHSQCKVQVSSGHITLIFSVTNISVYEIIQQISRSIFNIVKIVQKRGILQDISG